jgi:50S ribosomal subunit-associated GTPase HflX
MQPENKLFATLDTAVRSGKLPSGTQALFVDTVGFISDLPTSLVAAFKSTLDDIRQADVLVHVTDASDPDRLDQHAAVMEVLDQLDLPDQLLRQRICVHNKVDLLSPAQQAAPVEVEMVGASHSQRRQALILWQESPALDVSVTRGDNLNELRRRIEAAVLVAKGVAELTIRIGHDRPDVVQFAYKHGTVVKHTVTDDGKNTVLTVLLPQPMLGKLKALKGSRE